MARNACIRLFLPLAVLGVAVEGGRPRRGAEEAACAVVLQAAEERLLDLVGARVHVEELHARAVDEGEHAVETEHDYTSHNTQRLSVEEVAELLAKLPEMREALAKVPR